MSSQLGKALCDKPSTWHKIERSLNLRYDQFLDRCDIVDFCRCFQCMLHVNECDDVRHRDSAFGRQYREEYRRPSDNAFTLSLRQNNPLSVR